MITINVQYFNIYMSILNSIEYIDFMLQSFEKWTVDMDCSLHITDSFFARFLKLAGLYMLTRPHKSFIFLLQISRFAGDTKIFHFLFLMVLNFYHKTCCNL